MSEPFSDLISKFVAGDILDEKQSETLDCYEIEILFKCLSIPPVYDIKKLFDVVSSNDNLEIGIMMDDLDPIVLNKKNLNRIDRFIEDLNDGFKSLEDESSEYKLKIVVNKNIVNKTVSLYNFKLFKEFLKNNPIYDIINYFNDKLSRYNTLNIQIYDETFGETNVFFTRTLFFSSVKTNEWNKEGFLREDFLRKRDSVCNFYNSSDYKLVPDDFFLIKKSPDDDFNLVFENLCFILSVVFMSDYSQIDRDNLSYKINGYRTVEGKLSLSNFKHRNCKVLFDIYKWVYFEGNLIDKIGIARNIISLNIKQVEDNELSINESTLGAIKSNFEIYLKENVDQYIEIKNKVTEFLIEKSLQVSQLVRDFINSFKHNSFVIVTFFTSIVVYNSLSSNKTQIISDEIAVISYAILLISFIYFICSVIFINIDKKRFQQQYDRLKRMYAEILSEEDLSNIFLESQYNEDIDYMKQKRNLFAFIWAVEILFLLLAVIYLDYVNDPFTLKDIFKNFIKVFF